MRNTMLGTCTARKGARAAGFTLIELMVTVVIVSILASIAVPSYMSSVRKSRRTEAKTALLDLAAREERYLATNTTYSDTAADLGYSNLPGPTSSGYYQLAVNVTSPTATAAATFTATATAVAGKGQDKDTNCSVFKVTQTGVQSSANSGGTDTTATGGCWN
jgi:type IV pilus assembly protein PilE